MIIPVRCFTCNKVLADAWEAFVEKCQAEAKKTPKESPKQDGLSPERLKTILKELGFTRICCNRHMLSHVDLIEYI